MAQSREPWMPPHGTESPDEADALIFENQELRNTAANLMLQTAILREALSEKSKVYRFD